MALTFKIPNLPKGMFPGTDLIRTPAMRPPTEVAFRPGADLTIVADEILSVPHSCATAPVGAGKSSLLPMALARRYKGLVIYVTANPLLALSAFQYACKRQVDDSSIPPLHRYVVGAEDDLPRTGVMYCGANEYVSALMRRQSAGHRGMSAHVVFLDEAHRCDMSTYVINHLSLHLGAEHLVKSSATLFPDSNIMRETPGKVVEKIYEFEKPVTQWRASEANKPWSAAGLTNNIIFFTDSKSEGDHLLDEYDLQGYIPHRLSANMAESDFVKVMADMFDKKGAQVAVVADNTFRDGFTFDVSVGVDTGRIGYCQYTPGSVARVYRGLYWGERIQTSGRFARLGNSSATYVCPDQEYPRYVCDLAPVEMEAAAYVFRLLGYAPTGELATAVMAHDVLPEIYDFATVVNAMYPLQHYVRDSHGRPRTPPPEYRKTNVQEVGNTAQVHGDTIDNSASNSVDAFRRQSGSEASYTTADSSSEGAGMRSTGSGTRSVGHVSVMSDVAADAYGHTFDMLYAKLTYGDKDDILVKDGDYCFIPGLPKADINRAWFPRGLESVDKYLPIDNHWTLNSAMARLSPEAQEQALVLVISRYNMLNACTRGILGALRRAYSDGIHDSGSAEFQRCMSQLAEEHTQLIGEKRAMLIRLKALCDGKRRVQTVSEELDTERDYMHKVIERINSSLYAGPERKVDVKAQLEKEVQRDWVRATGLQNEAAPGQDDWIRSSRKLPFWSGCKKMVQYRDPDGNLTRLKFETNAIGRFVTGREKLHVTPKEIISDKNDGTRCVESHK